MYEYYSVLLHKILELNRYNRMGYSDFKHTFTPLEYVNNLCTVSLDMGRGVGKTRFIMENAKKNDLVLVHYSPMIKVWKELDFSVLCPKWHSECVDRTSYKFDTIWVDEPKLVFKDVSKDEVLRKLISSYDQTVIMLGSQI